MSEVVEKGGIDPNTGMSENNMKKADIQNQVNMFIFGLLAILIVSTLVISTKFLEHFYH